MDFGRIPNIADIDFSLPPDDLLTIELFESLRRANGDLAGGATKDAAGVLAATEGSVNIYVGCTQWRNKNWIGKVYPKGTKETDLLAHYGKQFNSIELNAMFYNLQPKQVIERWASQVGAGFRFCPKFSNTISHDRQLKDAERDTDLFLDHMLSFGGNLGASFLQLSEGFGPNRAQVLQDYVRRLPRDFTVCVELRSEGWFERGAGAVPGNDAGHNAGAVEDTWRSFLESGIGSVITDTAGRRDCLHMRLTAPVAFIRYVGNNLHPTDFLRIDAWVDRIKTWIDKGLREVYFFVHSPEELNAPELCKYVVEQFNKKCGTDLKPPRLLSGGDAAKLTLF